MVILTQGSVPWDPTSVTLYQTHLGNLPLYLFYGPSTTTNATFNSSRIQVHIFSIAGYRSFPRLTVSPTSPLYEAVSRLPEERQGDEVSRGLAISVFKYFGELSPAVRQCLSKWPAFAAISPRFDAGHAARLAANLIRSENTMKVATQLMAALSERQISWVDVDVMVSREVGEQLKSHFITDTSGAFTLAAKKSPMTDFLTALGSPAFLPTSKLRRAPSRPTGMSKIKSLSSTEVEAIQREMMEATETEVSYVKKLRELDHIFSGSDATAIDAGASRYPDSSQHPGDLFQQLLLTVREILDLNSEFLNSIVDLMDETSSHSNYGQPNTTTPGRHDLTGAETFAKILLAFLPRFSGPYQKYLKLSPQIPRVLLSSHASTNAAIACAIAQIGEKRLKSWLIEPVQRLPRYSLFIDKMIALLPPMHSAMNKFLRAKDLITDICALESEDRDSEITTLRHLRELVSQWPSNISSPGRLIAIVDALALRPPYCSVTLDEPGIACLIVIFTGLIVTLKKTDGSNLTSRGLLAEIQRPIHADSTFEPPAEIISSPQPLEFGSSFPTNEVKVSETGNGRDIMFITSNSEGRASNEWTTSEQCPITIRAYRLQGPYEEKAAKVVEELTRARIENRFIESIRDGPAWSFRVLPPEQGQIGLIMAVFDPDVLANEGEVVIDRGKIVIDAREDTAAAPPDKARTIYDTKKADLRVSKQDSFAFTLEALTVNGLSVIHRGTAADLIPLIRKRGK